MKKNHQYVPRAVLVIDLKTPWWMFKETMGTAWTGWSMEAFLTMWPLSRDLMEKKEPGLSRSGAAGWVGELYFRLGSVFPAALRLVNTRTWDEGDQKTVVDESHVRLPKPGIVPRALENPGSTGMTWKDSCHQKFIPAAVQSSPREQWSPRDQWVNFR